MIAWPALAALALTSAAAAGSDWPQSRRDARNSGAIELEAPASGKPRAWTFEGVDRVWGYTPGATVWSSPALALVKDRAIVAAGSYDSTVHALDAASGEHLWRFIAGGPVYSTPALWNDGARTLLFAASSDRSIYALDADSGRSAWVHSVEEYRPTLGGAHLSAPAVGAVRGTPAVFVGHHVWDRSVANSLQRAAVSAFSAADGKPLWSRPLGDNELTAPIFAQAGGRDLVVVGSSNGNVYALDATDGAVLWNKTELDAVRGPPAFTTCPAGALVVSGSKFGMVRGLDALTGAQRWQYKTGDRITSSPAVLEMGGRELAVVGSYDRTLHALDRCTGERVWSTSVAAGIYSSPAVVPGTRPLVLFSAWDHMLHVVSGLDGARAFQVFTGRPIWDSVGGLDESSWSSPVAARVNGSWMAYVASYDGLIRALPLEDAEREVPPVRSNFWFWLSFPLGLIPTGALAVLLTRLERRRGGVQG